LPIWDMYPATKSRGMAYPAAISGYACQN